ncbi:MAG TPA: helix-turn-helix domain-containing protein [Bacteroidales bacterium]|nr:helix-turn-helix domain-containing protein [Bacteroidales bacterium]
MKKFFPANIKLLRKRLDRTQEEVAFALNLKRSTLSGYENEVAEPGVEALIALSGYYRISVDTLLKVDLSKLRESELFQLERGADIFYSGGNLRVLSATVDINNDENIELVNEKALAGYRTGFADPEYLKVLPAFQLPFLSRQKKYRTFQISGDSMLPITAGSWVTGEFVQNWFSIRSGQACIILTIADGLVFKIVENLLEKQGVIRAHSLNTLFEPYNIEGKEIREIWRFIHYISPELPEPNILRSELETTVAQLQKDMEMVKQKLALQKRLEFPE